MLGFDKVTFGYPQREPICRHFSWTLPEAGVVALYGPSGCGKTTLLRLLMGLEHPQSGKVLRPERVSAVFQEDRLLPWCTVKENVELVGGDVSKSLDYLQRFGLAPYADRLPDTLSGGEKRRVAIARGLTAPADLLLLDEPFTGLDEEIKQVVYSAVSEIAATVPVVLITHDEEEAAALHATVIRLTQPPITGTFG